MNELHVAGLRIAYERVGQGPPLVLLHGVLGDSRMWRRQLEELAAEFTVVAWDAPDCGRSSDPPETFRLPEYADVLVIFVDALGLGPPHLLGLSWGGGLALEVYRRHPATPASLILASAYAGWAGSLPADVVRQRLAQSLREADLPPDRWLAGWIPGLLTAAAPPEMIDEVTGIMSGFHPAGLRSMVRAFAEADLRDVLTHIDVPTLVLHGDADQRSGLPVAEALHASIPASRLVVMPGVGHLANVEAASTFNAEVREFLGSVQVGGAW